MAAAATLFSSTTSSGPLLLLKLRPSSPRLHSPLHHQNSHCLFFPSILDRSSLPFLRSTSRPPPTLHRRSVVAASVQSNFFKAIQTAWRIGKDGIEAGTNLVPASVPRPVARISVAVAAVTVGLFLFTSFISTAFFVLAMMGFIYFVYIALNKDEGPRGGGGGGSSSGSSSSTDEEALNEVRRIMDKYNQVVGWPPIRAFRINSIVNQTRENSSDADAIANKKKSNVSNECINTTKNQEKKAGINSVGITRFIKVNMDGDPIGRKVDLSAHQSYETLALALEAMFHKPTTGLSSSAHSAKASKLLDGSSEFVLTYEDKDEDWMLVGDVPWGMFLDTVKRLRIMRTSDANGLCA